MEMTIHWKQMFTENYVISTVQIIGHQKALLNELLKYFNGLVERKIKEQENITVVVVHMQLLV